MNKNTFWFPLLGSVLIFTPIGPLEGSPTPKPDRHFRPNEHIRRGQEFFSPWEHFRPEAESPFIHGAKTLAEVRRGLDEISEIIFWNTQEKGQFIRIFGRWLHKSQALPFRENDIPNEQKFLLMSITTVFNPSGLSPRLKSENFSQLLLNRRKLLRSYLKLKIGGGRYAKFVSTETIYLILKFGTNIELTLFSEIISDMDGPNIRIPTAQEQIHRNLFENFTRKFKLLGPLGLEKLQEEQIEDKSRLQLIDHFARKLKEFIQHSPEYQTPNSQTHDEFIIPSSFHPQRWGVEVYKKGLILELRKAWGIQEGPENGHLQNHPDRLYVPELAQKGLGEYLQLTLTGLIKMYEHNVSEEVLKQALTHSLFTDVHVFPDNSRRVNVTWNRRKITVIFKLDLTHNTTHILSLY